MFVAQKRQRKSNEFLTAISAHVHFFASSSEPKVAMSYLARSGINKKIKKMDIAKNKCIKNPLC